MNKKNILLVSLISDQTIPNVQIINEFRHDTTHHLFISTSDMEKKGVRLWIEKACSISEQERYVLEVNAYSQNDILDKLNSFDFQNYSHIRVNLTGGTKMMTMVAQIFFMNLGCDIFYVTGRNNKFNQVSPEYKTFEFSSKINLKNYLDAYGFNIKLSVPSGIGFEQTSDFLTNYCAHDMNSYLKEWNLLQKKRKKGIKAREFDKVAPLLKALNYPFKGNSLSAYETRYLTGDWFEEYVGERLRQELELNEDEIYVSTEISKIYSMKEKNDPTILIGQNIESNRPDNEMDIMFVYNNTFYSIECKTSIRAFTTIQSNDGTIRDKEINILGETIYKSDSLKSKFGLYPKTTILTLTDFKDYCTNCNEIDRNNRLSMMTDLIKRANLSNIKLVDRSMLLKSTSLFELIK